MALAIAPDLLNIRVCNRVYESGSIGAEIIPNLPHLQQATWDVVGGAPGAPGSQAVGSFEIPLYPIGSEGYKAAQSIYALLDKGQRVEAYRGPIGAGAPAFTGIIEQLPRSKSSFTIRGRGDLWLEQLNTTWPGETVPWASGTGNNGVSLLKSYMGAAELGVHDDFNPYTAGNYTSAGTGSWAAGTDPTVGLPAVQYSLGAGASQGFLVYTASAAPTPQDTYSSSLGRVLGTLSVVPSGVHPSASGWAGFGYVYDPAGTNDQLRLYVTSTITSAGAMTVTWTAEWWAGGATLTTLGTGTVYDGLSNTPGYFPFDLEIYQVGTGAAVGRYAFVVNGSVVLSAPFGASQYAIAGPNGYVGLMAGGSNDLISVYFTNLETRTRYCADAHSTTAYFTVGTQTANLGASILGNSSLPATLIDVWANAAAAEACYYRYTPAAMTAGSRALGAVDFATSPGTDRSSMHEFTEGVDIIDIAEDIPTDGFATEVDISDATGTLSGGRARYSSLTAMLRYGVVSSIIPSLTSATFAALLNSAKAINNSTAQNVAARTITVVRTVDAAAVRELDTIAVHAPSWGIYHQSYLVLGYHFAQGSGQVQFTCSAFPFDNPYTAAARSFQAVARTAGQFESR